jgi:hypothetical protein
LKSNHGSTESRPTVFYPRHPESVVYDFALHDFLTAILSTVLSSVAQAEEEGSAIAEGPVAADACRPFSLFTIHHSPIPHPLSKLLSPKTLAQTSLSFCIFHSSFCIFFKPALDKN